MPWGWHVTGLGLHQCDEGQEVVCQIALVRVVIFRVLGVRSMQVTTRKGDQYSSLQPERRMVEIVFRSCLTES